MSPKPATAYDEFPFEGRCIPTTSPRRLAALAYFQGYAVPELGKAKVLEIGCGDGGNLLPLAFHHPDWTFVGLDPSQAAIQKAQEGKAELKLSNVTFQMRSAESFQSEEAFDFILCHGVYSWVSGRARAAILDIAATHLSASGLFYVSYNTLPGWGVRGLVRDRLKNAVRGETTEARALAAQSEIERLQETLGEAEGHPHFDLLRRELQFAAERPLFHLAHEYLTEINDPFWFGEVWDAAKAVGLQYVGDAQCFRPEGMIPPDLRARAEANFKTLRDQEESLDLIRYRQLRASVFSKQTEAQTLSRHEDLLSQTILSSALRHQRTPFDLAEGVAEPFACPFTQSEIEVDTANGKAALLILASLYPRGLTFDQLLQETAQLLEQQGVENVLGGEQTEDLLAGFSILHQRAMVEAHVAQPTWNLPDPTTFPEVHALAIYEAQHRPHLTSAVHDMVPIDAVDRMLVAHLDGHHTADALLNLLKDSNVENAEARLQRIISVVHHWGFTKPSE